MGAASSVSATHAAAASTTVTDDDLQQLVSALPGDAKAKLRAALDAPLAPAGPMWAWEYGVWAAVAVKDVAATMELVSGDAAIQVVEEPRAPRFALMGKPTTEGAEADERVFWQASFACKDAYHTDHKQRESNKTFAAELANHWRTGNPMEDMVGSYMGSLWHLERPGQESGEGLCAVATTATAKDAAAARDLIEVVKARGSAWLAADPTLLRASVIPPSAIASDMPGPKDERTVVWVETWQSAAAYAAHKAAPPATEAAGAIEALLGDPSADMTVQEFPATKLWIKPATTAAAERE